MSPEIQLAARPSGERADSTFALVQTEVRDLAEGEVLVRNLWMSVDPYMRGRMNDTKCYLPPLQLGAARVTVVHGLENAPSAFLGLLHGANIGKMLDRLG